MTVHITSVALSFGADQVLDDVSAIVRPRDRLAVVGRNGEGKTTLLRIVAGQLAPDGGDLSLPSGSGVALHDQRPPLASETTLEGYVAGAGRRAALEPNWRARGADGRGRRRCRGDARPTTPPSAAGARRRLRLAGADGERRARPRHHEEGLERPLTSFSGGELTRASLTRALAAEPDVLLLDEPTNHLDTDAIEWLEEHIDEPRCRCAVRLARPLVPGILATGCCDRARPGPATTKGTYSHFRRVEAERWPPRPEARSPAGRTRPSAAVRRPVPGRHQVAPGAVQAEGDGADRAGREGFGTALAGVRIPAAAAQRAGGAGRRRA